MASASFHYVGLLLTATCALSPVAVLSSPIPDINANNQLLDMSYAFDNDTVYWPSPDPADRRSFRLETISRGVQNFNNHTLYYEQNKFAAPEHGGTHMDAPLHFVVNGTSVADLPLSKLIGPAVKIDIQKQAQQSHKNGIDYLMTKNDVLTWEKQNEKIPNGSLVFVHTGYGKFWPDQRKYMGYDGVNAMDLHYPGITEEAAKLLVERGVKAVGIDTVSPDNMRNTPLVHVVLLNADVVIIENVASLDRLPATGATVYGLPLKIAHGSGAPVRLFAQIP